MYRSGTRGYRTESESRKESNRMSEDMLETMETNKTWDVGTVSSGLTGSYEPEVPGWRPESESILPDVRAAGFLAGNPKGCSPSTQGPGAECQKVANTVLAARRFIRLKKACGITLRGRGGGQE